MAVQYTTKQTVIARDDVREANTEQEQEKHSPLTWTDDLVTWASTPVYELQNGSCGGGTMLGVLGLVEVEIWNACLLNKWSC